MEIKPTPLIKENNLSQEQWHKAFVVGKLLSYADIVKQYTKGFTLNESCITDDDKKLFVNVGKILFMSRDKVKDDWVFADHKLCVIDNNDDTYTVEIYDNDSTDTLIFKKDGVKAEELLDIVQGETDKIKTEFYKTYPEEK